MAKPRARRKEPTTPTYDHRIDFKPFNGATTDTMVDNPYQEGQKITVSASLRDDPLRRLLIYNSIDQAQYAAGRHLQGLFEAAELGAIKAMDTTKEPVDGHTLPDMLSERQERAIRTLRWLRGRIDANSLSLLRDVLANRMYIYQAALARGYSGRSGIAKVTVWFRDSLEEAVEELGFGSRRKKRQ